MLPHYCFPFLLSPLLKILELSTTQSNGGGVNTISALYLKRRFVWKGVLGGKVRWFLLDCGLTNSIGASSSWQKLSHQGMRESEEEIHPLMCDFILVGYTCGTGDICTDIYGKIQWHRALEKRICQRIFACTRSLERLLVQQLQQLPIGKLECVWRCWNNSNVYLPSHSTISALPLTLLRHPKNRSMLAETWS